MTKEKRRVMLRDCCILILTLGATIALSFLLSNIHNDNNPFAVPVFILAVAIIARLTTGYFYGIAASAVSVLCVNYMFTYPFFELDMRLSGYPLTFASMLIVSILISTLTTQIKKQEQLKFDAEKEKLRANLLRSVSHDIRTPLASILGASSTLVENPNLDPQDRSELAQQIHQDARWLVRLIENILSVTRFSSGSATVAKDEEVVEEIVISAIGKFRQNHPEMPVEFTPPDEILLVPMNATLIEQVLLNLLDNVVSHGKCATYIRISVIRQHHQVLIMVEDNGVGIPKNRLEHLFDGRNPPAETGSDRGRHNLGIGLSACSGIILAHGGTLSA